MSTLQTALLKEQEKQRAKALSARLHMRSGGQAVPEKCPACGDYVCSCRCPGCEICGGSGYVKINPHAALGDNDFGKIQPCEKFRMGNLNKAIASGEGRGGLTSEELRILDWKLVLPNISDGTKALHFVRPAVERGYGMGIMLGTWGQAKTLLMKIAVANFIRAGKSAHYVKLTTLMDDIRTAYDSKENKMTALVTKIREWQSLDLLCIDEIDKDAGTEWAETRLFDMVDERWMLAVRQKALTLFASNYSSASEIPGYLKSRIEDNRFAMSGPDGKSTAFSVYLNGADGRKSMLPGRKY